MQKIPKRLTVKVSPSLWRELRLDEQDMYQRVLYGFYLGYGIESLRRLVQLRSDNSEVTEILRVAPLLGVSAEDRITSS